MAKQIVLIGHKRGEDDDRASAWAAAHGFEPAWCWPYDGESIPALTENIAATVIYGGSYDVHQKSELGFLRDELSWIEQCLKREVPTLGLCLGAQLMADVLGVTTGKHPQSQAEYGYYPLIPTEAGKHLFPEPFTVLEAHWEGWFELPSGAVHLASTEAFPQQAFRYGKNAWAFQFHPEAHPAMLARWVSRRPSERAIRPGAYPGERQLADAKLYDQAIEGWFHQFLDNWLGEASRGGYDASVPQSLTRRG